MKFPSHMRIGQRLAAGFAVVIACLMTMAGLGYFGIKILTGDVEARSRDETGELMQALHDMSKSLKSIVGHVREDTQSIASASSEIVSGNLNLSASWWARPAAPCRAWWRACNG